MVSTETDRRDFAGRVMQQAVAMVMGRRGRRPAETFVVNFHRAVTMPDTLGPQENRGRKEGHTNAGVLSSH